ncbi:MAG: Haloalkane dehalogenase [Candidatus Accumulibacter regalis]|jgi:pimeloyl-ACP methyl ester carboxylesterase|uniref:Haloalkane dehalogenase n=1 Tax=Accumulibacter regalis TaxID=522306 RepID=A0A011RIB6_ACCRE|nr:MULTISPECIES: alpha/beta hydrolase [unclassified Candidatus Accumulibacter]EXI90939.1 MAG: Haloalkane dehalogenase [Candidatus Accumulibacter regalis]MBL8367920.1 alpha/beta hydrolase [Accumulibacter sp.]MBN8513847.1 alpha/beta hydrolase [Accumulibacter sp.]MBO3701410.1 alpha/beta hydrolase [Accumulibacter sp.]HRE69516.1 alpha/beta hydrolase [Accumulibacter sp.]
MSVRADLSPWLAGAPPGLVEREVRCASAAGLHRMAYTEWGERDNPNVLVCAHGLTRNGRDFDELARVMSADYRVICPDVVGRGRSDWLRDPSYYVFPQYVADLMVLLARLDVDRVHWLGTSMGGLIGMWIASQDDSPISRLVLNDVGPLIPVASLHLIGEYVGRAPRFATYDDAEKYVRLVSEPFGHLTDAQWRHLTECSLQRADDGCLEMRYDPAIGDPFRRQLSAGDVDLWPIYDAIRCPTLVVRGADSAVLTRASLLEMANRGPRPQTVEIPGVGHAPMFLDDVQIGVVRDFLQVA